MTMDTESPNSTLKNNGFQAPECSPLANRLPALDPARARLGRQHQHWHWHYQPTYEGILRGFSNRQRLDWQVLRSIIRHQPDENQTGASGPECKAVGAAL